MRQGVALLALAALAAIAFSARADSASDYIVPDDDYQGNESDPTYTIDDDMNALLAMPDDMQASPEVEAMLKKGEALRLVPYRLGDGGWTVGYGHYTADDGTGTAPPTITPAQADQLFDQDIEQRAAQWVRAYVTVPVTQYQFDALCHMAYNLKPSSFATIAAVVNAGDDPEAAALKYVRAGTNLERGLRLRRARELDLYRNGVYA